MGSNELPSKLPILDFAKEDLKPVTSSWLKACSDVRLALEEYGCFVVEYNRLPLELRDKVFGVLKELFDLPTETKMQNKYEKPLNGYVGQIAKLPLHESMGIDNATSLDATQNFTDLMWPNGNDRFWYVYVYCLMKRTSRFYLTVSLTL
jgi:isopenicillin N synthase-like dioxygenase